MTTTHIEQQAFVPSSISAEQGAQAAGGERAETPSSRAIWGGRLLSGFGVFFLLFDATVKLAQAAPAVEGTCRLGWSPGSLLPLGALQLACLALYLIPRTSILGAIVWTGYLGGAIATHARIGDPFFTHTIFPVYVALILWGGLWLRDGRLRSLLTARA